jgi:hypothetical protein
MITHPIGLMLAIVLREAQQSETTKRKAKAPK